MQIRQASTITVLCFLSFGYAALDSVGAYTLSRGRQLMLANGLQIQGSVLHPSWGGPATDGFSDINRWQSANFTTINFDNVWNRPAAQPSVLAQMPTGTRWGRWYPMGTSGYEGYKYLLPTELPYKNSLVSLQCGDEMSNLMDPNTLSDMAATYAEWRQLYPNALVYTNLAGLQVPYTVTGLQTYMAVAQPDMIMHDTYITNSQFYSPTSDGFYNRTDWYAVTQRYRLAGLAGIDGTGRTPIPYAQWLNIYRNSYADPLPSESIIRLQQNASWAFGYTFVNGYIYNSYANYSAAAMFNGPGDSSPSPAFNYVAETNRQSRNLGPALTRLVSTDVQMISATTGTHQESYWDGTWPFYHTKTVDDNLPLPDGISAWNRGTASTGVYKDYITGITPLGKDNGTSHVHSDVLIGYFAPLLSNNTGCTFVDGLHFMVVNGSIDGTASEAAELIRLTFDFTGSDFDSLVRLSRDTGKVELVTLSPTGGSNYYLDLNLPGGTGDLFAFWDRSNPLPTIPEPGALVMLATGLVAGLIFYIGRR